MDISEYIDAGYEKAGSVKALALKLGVDASNITSAKKHRRPLTDEACVMLAEYLDVSAWDVLKAAKIAAAKSEDQARLWRNAACIAGLTLVTNFVTPSPAEAAPVLKMQYALCILC